MAETEQLILNMGPIHPSTHGVLRFKLTMDGEIIRECVPVIGYLHRGTEKLVEMKTYLQVVPFTDRLDYIAAMPNNYSYVKAVEDLCGIKVSRRAEYIRIICMELNRIANHLLFTGALLFDLGAVSPIMYGFRDRENILALFEMLSGARLTLNYIRFGGVRNDIPAGFIEKTKAVLKDLHARIDDYEALINDNEIVLARMRGIGVIKPEDAINYSLTGPPLRGSGVDHDIRKDAPYSLYEEFDFKACSRKEGDSYARYMVRMDEIRESLKIVEQALDNLPEGDASTKYPYSFVPPKGEAYSRIESPKGELGFHVVSDGSPKPYRVKIRTPSFSNLAIVPAMVTGLKIPDLIASFGTIDIVLGDVDR